MGYQNFGTICAPFAEGEEGEIFIRGIHASSCVSVTWGNIPAGRELILLDAYALSHPSTSASLSTTASVRIGIYKNTLSTLVGSIICSQSAFATNSADLFPTTVVGSINQSVTFTSTDVICAAIATQCTGTDTTYKWDVIVRYREK